MPFDRKWQEAFVKFITEKVVRSSDEYGEEEAESYNLTVVRNLFAPIKEEPKSYVSYIIY